MPAPLSRLVAVLALTAVASTACSPAPSEVTAPPSVRATPSLSLNADQRLADADAAVEKAFLLIQASLNPSAPNPKRPFGGHDEKALRHLEAARAEIARAQAYADATVP